MKVPTSCLLLSCLAKAPLVFAAAWPPPVAPAVPSASTCTGFYGIIASAFKSYRPAQSFCSSRYPLAAITSTIQAPTATSTITHTTNVIVTNTPLTVTDQVVDSITISPTVTTIATLFTTTTLIATATVTSQATIYATDLVTSQATVYATATVLSETTIYTTFTVTQQVAERRAVQTTLKKTCTTTAKPTTTPCEKTSTTTAKPTTTSCDTIAAWGAATHSAGGALGSICSCLESRSTVLVTSTPSTTITAILTIASTVQPTATYTAVSDATITNVITVTATAVDTVFITSTATDIEPVTITDILTATVPITITSTATDIIPQTTTEQVSDTVTVTAVSSTPTCASGEISKVGVVGEYCGGGSTCDQPATCTAGTTEASCENSCLNSDACDAYSYDTSNGDCVTFDYCCPGDPGVSKRSIDALGARDAANGTVIDGDLIKWTQSGRNLTWLSS